MIDSNNLSDIEKIMYYKALKDKENELQTEIQKIRNKAKGLGEYTDAEIQEKLKDYFKSD